ncbi:hypothetical protein PaecuDRAFT_2884 [Paenibacillus curdlanolyticus YK9]|uniref:DUF5590 domain-containing protein n=1 Tax=Paenibacillus curdlanolyticus YK9 TaxID=717606 RepID=E0IAP4_9BACL|nr:hypothetical protein [Paenibacillus curdlanolyticus]EFM10448.1 hypothetical protein PaecuDRAFT_2884 [Paenibacillus curdlanolyticus YK9]
MTKRNSSISMSLLIVVAVLAAIVFGGYHWFESKMTDRPVPKERTVEEHFNASDVKLLGPAYTDMLQTSPYYYAFEGTKDGNTIVIIVDQNFGRSGANPLVEQSYVIIYPQIKNTNRIEVSDGQRHYEAAVTKKIISSDGKPVNLVFESEGKSINTYDWGLQLLKDY